MKPGNRKMGIIYITRWQKNTYSADREGRKGKPGCRGECPGNVGIRDLRVLEPEAWRNQSEIGPAYESLSLWTACIDGISKRSRALVRHPGIRWSFRIKESSSNIFNNLKINARLGHTNRMPTEPSEALQMSQEIDKIYEEERIEIGGWSADIRAVKEGGGGHQEIELKEHSSFLYLPSDLGSGTAALDSSWH